MIWWGWNQVHMYAILYIWFRKLTQGLPGPMWHHHSSTWPYPKIPWETNGASLKTGSNRSAIERRRRFNPWRDRVAEGRERDGEATDTSHTGKEGAGRGEEGGGGRRKLRRLRTFLNVSTRQQEGGRITDMTNFCGSQDAVSLSPKTLHPWHLILLKLD